MGQAMGSYYGAAYGPLGASMAAAAAAAAQQNAISAALTPNAQVRISLTDRPEVNLGSWPPTRDFDIPVCLRPPVVNLAVVGGKDLFRLGYQFSCTRNRSRTSKFVWTNV